MARFPQTHTWYVLPGITAEDFRRVWREVWKEVCEENGLEKPENPKEMRATDQREASQEQDARQSRLAMEADGTANSKTRERTEGAATVVQAMHGDSCTAQKVQDGPKTSTSFGVKAEPPDLPRREDVLVENGAAAPKSWLPSLEMRSPTAASGLLPIGKASSLQQQIPPSRSQLFGSTRFSEEIRWFLEAKSVLNMLYQSKSHAIESGSRVQEGRREVIPSMAARGDRKLGAHGCRGASWSELTVKKGKRGACKQKAATVLPNRTAAT